MKYIVTITLLFFTCLPAVRAQKVRFTDTGNVWHYLYTDVDGCRIKYIYSFEKSTTTVDTLVYNILNTHSYRSGNCHGSGIEQCLVREDTSSGLVFWRPMPGASADTTERILINSNWQLGDTIIASSFGDTFTHIIGLIDTVKVGGTDHKHFHMSPLPPYPPNAKSYSVVEGIGCIKNMFFMSFPSEFENGQNIYCFSNNGFRPLIAPAIGFYFDNATSCALDIQPAQIQGNNTLIVYPQPAFSVVNIQLPVIIQNGAIQIYDQLGRTISGDRVHNTSSIKVNRPITPGLYYYRIIDNATGRIWQGKVVFE